MEHLDVLLATFADAAASAELVVNATRGQGAMPAPEQARADNLADKVLIDISNPLDFSNGLATATGLARLGATVGIVGRDSSRSANGRSSETSRRNGRCARSRSRC